MRTLKHFITAICLLLCGTLNAQLAIDPVKRVYKIGGSSEIFISYSDGTHAGHGVLDVPEDLKSISSVEESWQTGHLDNRKTASATGDFNGDGAGNVVTVTANDEGGIRISIPLIGDDLKNNGTKEYDISLNEQDYTRIRVISGNFADNPQDEFAICYDLPGGLVIKLFKTDSDLNIEQIASFEGIARYDSNFDIASGDLNGDGIKEIVMVVNRALPNFEGFGNNFDVKVTSTYDLYVMTYNQSAGGLSIVRESKEIKLENLATEHGQSTGMLPWTHYADRPRVINEMRLACGGLNNNGNDDIAIGWSYYYCYFRDRKCLNYHWFTGQCTSWSPYTYYYINVTFINTFIITGEDKYNMTGEAFENHQNISLPFNVMGTRAPTTNQHIAMTLKAEQMNNLGRAVVLANNASSIHLFGMDDNDGLRVISQVEPASGQHLNIQGNEAFAVGDLNPDTTAMNFNKEVIILGSDKTAVQQLSNRFNAKVSITIAEIDKITAGEISFKPAASAIDFPFHNSENIELSAFLAGDFDLSDAEVFFVGTPVITLVENLLQPIVILNSPPVHFDVFGGEVFDLCNAYTGGTPPFHAKYITKTTGGNTTSITVDKGYGISSDFRAYAMSGGTGFEASVQANWEKGSSFYRANTQIKTIEEEKTIYTEDFVLRSSMNYNYYKYPVYDRHGEKLGDIAVLNPVSPNFIFAWESANDWTHPSYVFNHEPGNILSYKQSIKSQDFSTSPSPFIPHIYNNVPVHHTGDGSFKFTFDKISSGEDSYSLSGGVGASLFTKIGIETTGQLSLTPLGIGGSVASDVRIGVSSEISAYYHNSTLSTHSTELRNTFQVEGTIGRLAQRFDATARYNITPYIYRSQSGALVLDYMVSIPENMSWWKPYRDNFDLAFILPWRYATEKGSENVTVSRKQKTTDIQFYPPIARAGDTVVIIARVHNFSLKTFDDILKVDFYLGDPADGGVKLTDINGVTGSSRPSTMIYGATDAIHDREEYLTFIWEIPDTVSCSPRIYGVIDPENVYTEIHKNNNVGWNMLNIYDCQDCKYAETITHAEKIHAEQPKFIAYPNPFSSHCQIRFSLPRPENVQIDLYNLTGHKVAIVTSQWYDSGEHEVGLNAENLATGVYILRISAGSYSEVSRLVLVR
jgi:hypothetical protein